MFSIMSESFISILFVADGLCKGTLLISNLVFKDLTLLTEEGVKCFCFLCKSCIESINKLLDGVMVVVVMSVAAVVVFFLSSFSTSLSIQDDVAWTISTIATVATVLVIQVAVETVVASSVASITIPVVFEIFDLLFGVPCKLLYSLGNSGLLGVNSILDVFQSGTEHV